MAKQKLFEYVVLYHPKGEKDANQNFIEKSSEIIIPLGHMLGNNEQQVGTKLARLLDESYLDKLDEVEIIIRPFN